MFWHHISFGNLKYKCCNGEKIASINLRTGYDASLTKLTLDYRNPPDSGEWTDMNYRVYVSSTACIYGGRRVWCLCPSRGCWRRVAVLYRGSIHACRHCHKLAYGTMREQAHYRAGIRADIVRKRLRWEAGILNGKGGKLKGTHWVTFRRL